ARKIRGTARDSAESATGRQQEGLAKGLAFRNTFQRHAWLPHNYGGVAGLARRAGRLETRGFRHGWLLAVPPHPADGEVESASEIGGDEGYSARAESNPCAVTAWGVGQCRVVIMALGLRHFGRPPVGSVSYVAVS
ncbi:hypothetical protein THAOC_00211, partial [Thalassiosira oceanica]